MTTLVGSINESVSTNITSAEVSEDVPGIVNLLRSVWNYISLFFAIIFFQVNGLPAVFNLFIFWPLSAGTIFMIISIIRGN
jgi:hypothetical protein